MLSDAPIIKAGSRVKFAEENGPYTVKAIGPRFAICTKPFNPRRTVIYTIIDINKRVRSTNDRVFNPYDYKKQSDIDQCLVDLESGSCGVSRRNSIPLVFSE